MERCFGQGLRPGFGLGPGRDQGLGLGRDQIECNEIEENSEGFGGEAVSASLPDYVGGTAMLMAVPFLFLALLAPADAETHTGQASLYQSSVTTICVADETPCAQVWYGSQ